MNQGAALLNQADTCPSPAPQDEARAQWLELARNTSEPNAFYHPALLHSALDHLDPANRVRIIEARHDGALIGLMPVIMRNNHARYPVRNAVNWVHDQCFFGAPLMRAGAEQAAWSAILNQLDAAPWAGNFLHLEALDNDGPIVTALRQSCAAQQRGLTLIAKHERALLRSDLDGESYWQANVRQKKRKEIRRLINRLAETGTLTHARLADGGDVARWTEDFLTLERSGWKGGEGTALGSRAASRAYFIQALANAARQNMLDMLRIDVDGAPIAMLVNFRLGNGAFSYKIAFDERFARFSPGILIEIDNLHATLADPELEWMDSCAAPGHPMIDGIWAQRRTIAQFRVALRGRGLTGLKRRAAYWATGMAEQLIRSIKRESR